MLPDRSTLLALTGFEFRRGLSRQGAKMGFSVFVGAVAVGAYFYWFRNEAPGKLFGEGFLVWMMGLVCFGLAIDRRQAFDAYLLRNHTSTTVYLAAKALAVVLLIIAAGVFAVLLRTATMGGDIFASLWSGTALTLFALMVAPVAMLVEAHADTNMPTAFVVLGYIVAGTLVYVLRHDSVLFDATGVVGLAPGDWSSLRPLAIRSAGMLVLGFAAAGAVIRLSLRRY